MIAKPNLFIVGAAKSGTTSLYRYLLQHPQIWMPELKEPHFFGEHRPPGPEFKDLTEYLALFQEGAQFPVIGEASTAYIYSPSAATQIARFNPDAKIIISLRNPIDRAYSLYWHNVRAGVEDLTFAEALAAEEERIAKGWRYSYHYIQSGMYAKQVQRYMDNFPHRQVRVILFEALENHADQLVKDLFDYLEVDKFPDVKTGKVHNRSGPPRIPLLNRFLHSRSGTKRKMLAPFSAALKSSWKSKILELNSSSPPTLDAGIRTELRRLYAQDIESLAEIIGNDLRTWLEPREL